MICFRVDSIIVLNKDWRMSGTALFVQDKAPLLFRNKQDKSTRARMTYDL